MTTDELIKEIENWKVKKDDIEYRKKVAEENKVHAFLEQMNGPILDEIKNMIKLYETLLKCNVIFRGNKYSNIHFTHSSNGYCLCLKFCHCGCYIYNDTEKLRFLGKSECGIITNTTSNPPMSFELESFMKDFSEFKKLFYDFINETLNS